MKMQITNSLTYYEAIIGRLASYLLYPNDKSKRGGYYSKLFLDHMHEKKESNLHEVYEKFPKVMAELVQFSHNYHSPKKGYSLNHHMIVGQILLAMIRMKVSGIEPSLHKAYYFFCEIVAQDPQNFGIPKKGLRQLEQAWEKYKSVAHISLVIGMLGNTQDIAKYPLLLSSLYRTQKLYLDIIKNSPHLNFEIWEFPSLGELTWDKDNKNYPLSFIKGFNQSIVFEALNEHEKNIMLKYSKGYFNKGGAK